MKFGCKVTTFLPNKQKCTALLFKASIKLHKKTTPGYSNHYSSWGFTLKRHLLK